MESKELKISTINDAYYIYSKFLSDKSLCENNQHIMSILALQIDVFSLATILNFFNSYSEVASDNWQSNLLIIRMFSLATAELCVFLKARNYLNIDSIEKPNNFDDIISLRNKIHQFRYTDYQTKIQRIDDKMGRSRNRAQPHLDICLHFSQEKEPILFGTNIHLFHFIEAKDQATIDLMQSIIRVVEKESPYPKADFKIRKSKKVANYKWEPYCYTDIISKCSLNDPKLIDRLLLSFDDLCCIHDFFVCSVDVSSYLSDAPYLTFYFVKIIAIILDETFDNLSNYIRYGNDRSDCNTIKEILMPFKPNMQKFCRSLRNNLHYERQESLIIDNEYLLFNELFRLSETLLQNIRRILNINPSKAKLRYYRFLRWVQQ